jgi:hypothetical protein
MLSGHDRLPGYKRPDLSLADRLFIGAVVNLPPERRPWGSLTWLADVFATSRPTLYAIGERARSSLAARLPGRPALLAAPVKPPAAEPSVTVTSNRRARTILTLLLPGGVSGRTVDDCLRVAFDQGQSAAFVADLLHLAGQRAGAILEKIDHSPLGPVVLARDELFTGRDPNLLLVEPHPLVITGLYATADRDAETWGCVLLLTQDRRVQIKGLAEDDCIPYAASCRAAGLETAIQKDVWHPLRDVGQVIRDLEREALQAMTTAAKLEKRLTQQWRDATFAEWVTATEHSERLLEQSAQLRFWRECLWDAVEVVDLRSGEIRDRAINQWLLTETLTALRQLNHPRIQKLVKRLDELSPGWLTFLEGLAFPLAQWQVRLAEHFPDPTQATSFQSSVARLWRLEHTQRSGQTRWRKATAAARQRVAEWVAADPLAQRLAEDLLTLLERTVRTSSAAETINSVLRPYLNGRREGTDRVNRQLFLNLFALWFNLHRFERGPRQGQSPYELAGIEVGTDDWLTLLGFPPD